jgi:transcriptional antiterminator NusG
MGKQDPRAGRNWYVVHTYAGYEDSVKQSLEQRIESLGMQDYIFNIEVPKASSVRKFLSGRER